MGKTSKSIEPYGAQNLLIRFSGDGQIMRTTRHSIFLLLVLTVAFAKAQNANDWENPQIIGVNKEQTTAMFIGTYQSTLTNFITPYISTQDNSNRCDTRVAKFTDKSGHGMEIKGIQPFAFRAWPYLESDLEAAKHDFEITHRDFININIDSKIHVVGGDDSWGARTHKKYTIDGNKAISFGFIFQPVQ